MIRKFLAREGQILLAEVGAPDTRTLLRRIAFWILLYGTTTAALLGLVWVWRMFGVAAMGGVVFLIILVALQLEQRLPIYTAWDEPFADGRGRLPPPGNKALPVPGARQISRSQCSSLPRPKK